ncbi:MAG: BLUF domain-containing protein [Pseudomonadota bacterium]|nr:BLUF domain-containing protein [Pseudomonadota bacterium]
MFQAVYATQAVYHMGHLSDAEILATGRLRARQFDLTGFLLRTDQTFLGVVEGDERAVNDMLDRIARDPRRRMVMRCGPYHNLRRMFPDWSMGYGPMRRDGFDDDITALKPTELDRHVIVQNLIRIAHDQWGTDNYPLVQT